MRICFEADYIFHLSAATHIRNGVESVCVCVCLFIKIYVHPG